MIKAKKPKENSQVKRFKKNQISGFWLKKANMTTLVGDKMRPAIQPAFNSFPYNSLVPESPELPLGVQTFIAHEGVNQVITIKTQMKTSCARLILCTPMQCLAPLNDSLWHIPATLHILLTAIVGVVVR